MRLTVVYDGNCVICRTSKRVFGALDWLHQTDWIDLHEWDALHRRFPSIQYDEAMGAVHVIDGEGAHAHIDRGFFGTRRILRELPLGFPVWLLLYLPGMTWLGQRVYAFIARNRYTINRLVGAPVCESDTCRVDFGYHEQEQERAG